jgi:hypothetical protein
MSESNKPFVITDRRKFTVDGTPRLDADPSPEREEQVPVPAQTQNQPQTQPVEPERPAAPEAAAAIEEPTASGEDTEDTEGDFNDAGIPPPPTAEQMEQSRLAFEATADRIDIAIRSANPGLERQPPMSFEQIVQSVYMQAILQLGGGTQQGQQPQVDLLGARHSIDMLSILAAKTTGNLSDDETRLIESAIFELRLAFLEITQALARSAAARAGGVPSSNPTGPGGAGGAPPRPSIVR